MGKISISTSYFFVAFLFLISICPTRVSSREWIVDKAVDVNRTIFLPVNLNYHENQEGSCDGVNPIIPEEDFRGTSGFWTTCNTSSGPSTFTYYRSLANKAISIKLDVYFSGVNVTFQTKLTPQEGDTINYTFRGSNEWQTITLDSSLYPNFSSVAKVDFEARGTANGIIVYDMFVFELEDPTTTTTEAPTTTEGPTTTEDTTITEAPTTTEEPTTTTNSTPNPETTELDTTFETASDEPVTEPVTTMETASQEPITESDSTLETASQEPVTSSK